MRQEEIARFADRELEQIAAQRELAAPDLDAAVGVDQFAALVGYPGYGYSYGAAPPAQRTFRVQPTEGKLMARLGGPFTSPLQSQPLERYRLERAG